MIKSIARLFYNPYEAISEICGKNSISVSVSVVCCMFIFYICSGLLIQLIYFKEISLLHFSRIATTLFVEICIMWIIGCGFIYLCSRGVKARGRYLKLLTVVGYLAVVGIPFPTFRKIIVCVGQNTVTNLYVDLGLAGIISPLLHYLKIVSFTGNYWALSAVSVFNVLVFVWSFVLIVLSVQIINKTSILQSLGIVLGGLTLYSILFIIISLHVNLVSSGFNLIRIPL